jgi:hypothetical protein
VQECLIYFHIPRTAGTYFNHAIGDYLANGWKHHYNYTENASRAILQRAEKPALQDRTIEQDLQIKVMSGHSLDCQSHNWLQTTRTTLYYSIVRDPVERLLSSFHYRRLKSIKLQNENIFSHMMPEMIDRRKSYNDYNTLFEYCLNSPAEKNLQASWLLKSFGEYVPQTDEFLLITEPQPLDYNVNSNNERTVPQWMYWKTSIDRQLIDSCIKKMWWISDFNNLESDTKYICNYLDIKYNEVALNNWNSTTGLNPIWTIEDVKNQPDYQSLLEWLELDYYLYNKVKLLERPNDLLGN